jgi:nucleoside-diphosphate-sugar epimerase
MEERIAITGSSGTIGTVMMRALTDYEIVPLDLPRVDVRDYGAVLEAIKGCRAVIHLAWNLKDDNWDTGRISTDNDVMTFNVYEACLRGGVPRIIAASSVHADNFMKWKEKSLMNTTTVPIPTSPYGANKVFLEALGRFYAQEGLVVVCVRFGAVSRGERSGDQGVGLEKGLAEPQGPRHHDKELPRGEEDPQQLCDPLRRLEQHPESPRLEKPARLGPQDDAFARK